MSVGEICNRMVLVANPDNTILEASQLMRQHHVESLVVVEQRDGSTVPVGIVTGRDLAEAMAPEVDQTVTFVGDVMMSDVCTIKKSAGLFEAIEYMRANGVRRLLVVNQRGGLAGILALDDLLELLAEELLPLSKLMRQEHKKETLARRYHPSKYYLKH